MGFPVEKHKLRDDFGVPHAKQPQSGQRAGAQNWILQNLTLCKRSHHSHGIFMNFRGIPWYSPSWDKTWQNPCGSNSTPILSEFLSTDSKSCGLNKGGAVCDGSWPPGQELHDGPQHTVGMKLRRLGENMSTRPGKLTVCYGKSPFRMGKSTINVPSLMAMLNYQRVTLDGISEPHWATNPWLRIDPVLHWNWRFALGVAICYIHNFDA